MESLHSCAQARKKHGSHLSLSLYSVHINNHLVLYILLSKYHLHGSHLSSTIANAMSVSYIKPLTLLLGLLQHPSYWFPCLSLLSLFTKLLTQWFFFLFESLLLSKRKKQRHYTSYILHSPLRTLNGTG